MNTTPGGWLLILAVLLPFLGVMLGLVLGGRRAQHVAALILPLGLAIAVGIAATWLQTDGAVVYVLGGWTPPLGIALRADGPAVVMIGAIALVVCAIGVYARADFGLAVGAPEARAPLVYWLLLMAVWGSLNLVFVSGDLFTLYVALELLTFSGVPLVCLDGRGETLRSALRYLLFALAGSILYLLGAVLLYGGYGTLDIALLADSVAPEPIAWAAAALMTVGLLAKTALFPLHIWLPPAHAGAPAAASAVLSALVIKGSWFLVVRLWFDVMPNVVTLPSAQLLAAMGAMAIVVGSVVALRQERLKLLVAYSTVAQIGYLFLMFPLAFDATGSALAQAGRPDRRRAAGRRARDSQGRHVHGGRPDLRCARPRPHCRPRRRRARHAGHGNHLRRLGRRADGRGAERRLPRQEAAARCGRSVRAVVVDDRAAGRRGVHGRLCGAVPGQRHAPPRRTAGAGQARRAFV